MRDFAERDRSPVFLSSVHQSFIHALAEQPARRGCTSFLSFHPHCCFRPPANPFLSAPPSCGCVFSLGHMCDRTHQTARKGGGSMWSLAHILPRRPLCWRRCTRSVCLACVSCAWERVCVCVRLVPALWSAYLRVSEEAWRGSRWVGVGAGRSCKSTSSGPSSPKLLASGD